MPDRHQVSENLTTIGSIRDISSKVPSFRDLELVDTKHILMLDTLRQQVICVNQELKLIMEANEKKHELYHVLREKEVSASLGSLAKDASLIEEKRSLYNHMSEMAIQKAELNLTQRLEQMNEFRTQLTEERGTYIRRDQYDDSILLLQNASKAELAALNGRIATLEKTSSNLDGKFWAIGAVIVLVNLGISLLPYFHR